MREIKTFLPNMASDTAGAASALFELGGLTVIHDAAGSMESYITFDEPRKLEGKRTVSSRLSRLEAITGDDTLLLDKLLEESTSEPTPFIAIIGSPIPFTIGADLDGLAAEAEYTSGVPSFAVNAGGFELYDKGVGEALKKLIEKVAYPPSAHDGYTVNLLGATPLDYSEGELEGIRAQLLAHGVTRVNCLTMAEGIEAVCQAAQADLNLVISAAGLSPARYMRSRYGIPYAVGVPTREFPSLPLPGDSQPQPLPETQPGRDVLILGEAVLSKSLARTYIQETGFRAVAGVTATDDPEILADTPHVLLDTEERIRAELAKDYCAVVGDPLYKLLLPANRKSIFIERPHRALSSRLYQPSDHRLEHFISELKRVLL